LFQGPILELGLTLSWILPGFDILLPFTRSVARFICSKISLSNNAKFYNQLLTKDHMPKAIHSSVKCKRLFKHPRSFCRDGKRYNDAEQWTRWSTWLL